MAGVRREFHGQWIGATVAMTGLVGGFYLIATGLSAWGIAAVLGDLAAFTAIFVIGRRSQVAERQQKHARFVQRAS